MGGGLLLAAQKRVPRLPNGAGNVSKGRAERSHATDATLRQELNGRRPRRSRRRPRPRTRRRRHSRRRRTGRRRPAPRRARPRPLPPPCPRLTGRCCSRGRSRTQVADTRSRAEGSQVGSREVAHSRTVVRADPERPQGLVEARRRN